MISYRISPYVNFIESRLIPDFIQHGVSHRLTGEVLEPGERARFLLLTLQTGNRLSLNDEALNRFGDEGHQLKQLLEKDFLIPDGYDPLARFVNHYVARPIQNPALAYHAKGGNVLLVRTSMAHHVFSPRSGELPEIIEEIMPALAAVIFEMADGTRTLQEIFTTLGRKKDGRILDDAEFKKALDWLTTQERQLVKVTAQRDDLEDPYQPVNIVPRDLYHSSKGNVQQPSDSSESIIGFHVSGIEEAEWEFDQIEPTLNHALRFPDQMLRGLDYGSRFCVSTLSPEVTPSLRLKKQLDVLEVGAGTGTFGRSFIEQAKSLVNQNGELLTLNYHILDLSPVLIENQRQVLADLLPEQKYFHQNATELDLPGQRFDLIIANEVIADFPVASVQALPVKNGEDFEWTGEGASYLKKYGLTTEGAPREFKVNSGAMMFIERCWQHLSPGGTVVLSEYGSTSGYPVQSFHLNHDEFSIQFTLLAASATKVGFTCRLQRLAEFLALDQEVRVFCGREEHILCLNHVLSQQGISCPYAIVSEAEFAKRFGKVAEETELSGYSFLPLKKGFYFGPRIEQFMVLILNKPE